jgi:DNA-binding transcriptional LysR family regulator
MGPHEERRERTDMAANRLVEMDAFVRVARNQNFIAAASELGVSPGLVTRRLQQLEADLGVRLISRTTRRLSLTEAGNRYYKFCTRILKELHEEEAALQLLQKEPRGHLAVIAPMSFGIMEMGKAVTVFMQQYPEIQVTLIIGDSGRRSFDPVEYGADLVIRFTQPRDSSLYARKIGTMSWIACASPSYLRKNGTPRKPVDLPRHSCLVTARPFGNGMWKFGSPSGPQTVKVSGVVSPSSAITMRYMVLDGAGVALLPTFCVAEDIRKGRLVRILSSYSVPDQPICAYYPHARQQPMKMNLFLEFLEARFRKATWGVD